MANTEQADPRPVIAVAGFEREGEATDAWIPVAMEELLTRRLRRTTTLVVVPTIRLYQGNHELGNDGDRAEWPDVAAAFGAEYLVSGEIKGHSADVHMVLAVHDLRTSDRSTRSISVPAGRFVEVLDAATTAIVDHLECRPDAETLDRLLQPPSSSPSAIEYYAKSLIAARKQEWRSALRYAGQSLQSDRRFRPALVLLAQIESRLGPSGRGTAGRRLRALNDLSRAHQDPIDRVHAELGQSVLHQANGAFEAAVTRAETALAMAYEIRDVYGQIAAITTLCDLYMLRPVPVAANLSAEARARFARQNLRRAVEWQQTLVDLLAARSDRLGGIPATNKLAVMCERLERHELALQMHRRALELAESLGSRRHRATAYMHLGQWYQSRGQLSDALDAITRCLSLADEEDKPRVHILLGGVYQDMNMPNETLEQYQTAYDKLRHTDELMSQFMCLQAIAVARMELGQRDRAIATLQEAIDIAYVLELRETDELKLKLEAWKRGDS